jgi:voltage-gated potassium channel Kch
VTGALRALAARTAGAEAPARVEWSLRGALRESKTGVEGGSGRRAGLVHAVGVALLASAAVLAVVVVVPRGTSPRAEQQGRAASPVAAPASPTAARGEEADFVSLGYGEDLREMDGAQVVQIELPRTALAAFGWPAGDAQSGAVTAEVIMGHDGVARAIRLVE